MMKTQSNVNMGDKKYDICVIGGGINGAGIARDAAGRGYKVLLLEKGDLANATSSASTKLIHGGLRYLEHFEFGLVKKALRERDVLMYLAPHIIWPMRFVLPHAPFIRPFWMIRLGVFLYDFLSGPSNIKKSNKTNIKNKFLNQKYNKAIAYSDLWVDDARLVVLNAMDAMAHGADVKVGVKALDIQSNNGEWSVTCDDGSVFQSQMVVNAGGPWVSDIMAGVESVDAKAVRLVKGSHIIIQRLYEEDNAYILQNDDNRIVFTIPYEGDYTLVGTTDVDVENGPDEPVSLDGDEKKYLSDVLLKCFNKKIKDTDIIHSFSGVRPLVDDGEADAAYVTRDYILDLQRDKTPPFLSVIGGKITTYRKLAEEAVDKIDDVFGNKKSHWTAMEKLPGGDIADDNLDRYIREQISNYPFLSKSLVTRYAKTYGTCMNIILHDVTSLADMGDDLGAGIYGREIDYQIVYEFARTADDVLWRRTKMGLHVDNETVKSIQDYMASHAVLHQRDAA